MAGRGGKREGAGRKKVGVIRKVSVNMPQDFWDYADGFETFTDCVKDLWKSKSETGNQNKEKEIGNQNQTNENGNSFQTDDVLSDSEKKKVTKESKAIADIIHSYSDPVLVIVKRLDQIGPRLAQHLYERLMVRKLEGRLLEAAHEAWKQYSEKQQKLEEIRSYQEEKRMQKKRL